MQENSPSQLDNNIKHSNKAAMPILLALCAILLASSIFLGIMWQKSAKEASDLKNNSDISSDTSDSDASNSDNSSNTNASYYFNSDNIANKYENDTDVNGYSLMGYSESDDIKVSDYSDKTFKIYSKASDGKSEILHSIKFSKNVVDVSADFLAVYFMMDDGTIEYVLKTTIRSTTMDIAPKNISDIKGVVKFYTIGINYTQTVSQQIAAQTRDSKIYILSRLITSN